MNARRIGTLGVCGMLLLLVFLLSLIPVFWIGAYDRMYRDDYDFSALTRESVREEGTADGLFHAALLTVETIYETWQGTYSAVFLFSLQPAIWGQSWYAITPLLLIGSLLFGLGVFARAVCEELFPQKKNAWLVVWTFASILCVQFPRDATEGFFWYNGGMFYTFLFGLFLAWLGLAVRLISRRQQTRAVVLVRGIGFILLGSFLAGGNYPTALLLGILLAGATIWCARKRRALLPVLLISLAVFGAGFYASVSAPGNSVRQALLEQQTPLRAVVSACCGTPIRMLGQLLRHPGVPALLLLVWAPFCVVLVRNVDYRFRAPLLAPLVSWLVLAAMFTPCYYAMGNAGSYRLWNIVIFACYLLLMGNVFYAIGWWKRRFPERYARSLARLQRWKRLAPAYLVVTVCLSILLSGVGPNLGIERESATSVRAARSLWSGSPRAYAEAFDRQAEALERAKSGEATIHPIPEPGELLPDGDLTRYVPNSYEPSRWFDHEIQMEQMDGS